MVFISPWEPSKEKNGEGEIDNIEKAISLVEKPPN
jgi:hypothetical protein